MTTLSVVVAGRVCKTQVYWSKRSQSSSSIFVNDKKQTVSSDQTSLRLPDLDPDSTYYVQVTLRRRSYTTASIDSVNFTAEFTQASRAHNSAFSDTKSAVGNNESVIRIYFMCSSMLAMKWSKMMYRQMSPFEAKMHQIRFRLRLCPRPRYESLQHAARSPGWI